MGKWIVNKCDKSGNILTGYEQEMLGDRLACEREYRDWLEYDGPIDMQKAEGDDK